MPETGASTLNRRWQLSGTIQHGGRQVIVRACVAALCAVLAGSVGAATEYADRTDQQLTELAAGWEKLSEDERRALLTEIKARMRDSANANKVPMLTIKTERRYGRIVRRPDGSLVRIETTEHTIRYQRVPDGAAEQPFGVGFEQRSTSTSPTTAQQPSNMPVPANAVPVIPVGHANQR
jgi:hypothetical protein